MSVVVKTPSMEELNFELATLLRALRPYSMDELDEMADRYEMSDSMKRAYDRLRDINYLLGHN